MQKYEKFLYTNWLQATDIQEIEEKGQWISASARYIDYCGASHSRKIKIGDKVFECHDTITGNFNRARLRYKMPYLEYNLNKSKVTCDLFELRIRSSSSNVTLDINDSQAASFYMKLEPTKSGLICVNEPSTIITRITFK